MPRAPLVSIAIPTYNSARYLGPTIDSILRQSMPDLELILFDDGSTDETRSISSGYATRDPRVRVACGNHGGISAARNGAIAAMDRRSEFILLFDHDDVWEPDALEQLMNAIARAPASVAAHGLARCIDADGALIPGDDHAERSRNRFAVVDGGLVSLPSTSPTTFGALLVKNYPTTPGTTLVRRAVFDRIGPFEASTSPCDDWDMNLRLARQGDFAFVDSVLLSWRRHGAAASNVSTRWREAYMNTRRRTIEDPTNTPSQREAARHAARIDAQDLRRNARSAVLRGSFGVAARKVARSLLLESIGRSTSSAMDPGADSHA